MFRRTFDVRTGMCLAQRKQYRQLDKKKRDDILRTGNAKKSGRFVLRESKSQYKMKEKNKTKQCEHQRMDSGNSFPVALCEDE